MIRKISKNLAQPSQLNCAMDYHAKKAIWDTSPSEPPQQCAMPLEPVCIFHERVKITANMGAYIRYITHKELAKSKFHSLKIFVRAKFDLVDWPIVYKTLQEVPKLFQPWACKQMMGIAGTKEWGRSKVKKCPSCMIA